MQNLQDPDLVIIVDRFMPISVRPNYRHIFNNPLEVRTNRIPLRRGLRPRPWIEGLRALPSLQRADHLRIALRLVIRVVAEERRHCFRLRMAVLPGMNLYTEGAHV